MPDGAMIVTMTHVYMASFAFLIPLNNLKTKHKEVSYKTEVKQLEYAKFQDSVLDFHYQQLLCKAIQNEKSVVNNQRLREEVKIHLASYSTEFNCGFSLITII